MPASLRPSQEVSRLEELRTRIKLYQGTRSARRRMEAEFKKLEQRRNLPLPHELMGMIFDFYVHLYGQIPERLLLVCHSWHVLALSQPTLWTNLDPLGPFGLSVVRPWAGTFLQSRISRSNPVPLKVDFSRWSHCILQNDAEKIAGICTFRSRIQELLISRPRELPYLIGSQPLLTELSIEYELDELSKNSAPYMLSEKTITTLCLRCQQETHIWPESLLRRLQTLEVTLEGSLPGIHGDHECWSMVEKSVALLDLHVNVYFMSAPPLSHASCRSLSIAYCDSLCSVEEVRMPRLQELNIETYGSTALTHLTLVDTPVSSLRLTREGGLFQNIHRDERASWVGGAIRLLRSTPRLARFEISAPFDLVCSVLKAIVEDSNLCMELNTFIVDPPMPSTLEAWGKDVEASLEQLTSQISALLDQRRALQRIGIA